MGVSLGFLVNFSRGQGTENPGRRQEGKSFSPKRLIEISLDAPNHAKADSFSLGVGQVRVGEDKYQN